MKNEIVKRKLTNGVIAYLYSDKNLKRMVASYSVNYGFLGYYDKFYLDDKLYKVPVAMAHFLEHTLVETASKGNLLLRFKEKSYEVNALTSSELTTFYFVGIKDTWESIKELIEAVDKPSFNEENIENVKFAIVEEATKTMNEKYRNGYNANKRNAFKAFEAAHESYSTLGTGETTKSITIEDVRACYDAYYYDENKFLVIGGNFDIDEMVDYLEDIYKDIPKHEKRMREFEYGDLLPIRTPYEEIEKPIAMDHEIITYKIRNDFCDDYKISTMLNIYLKLKFMSSTKFVTELNKDKVIVGEIGHVCDFFKGVISIRFTADVNDDKEFLKRLEGELNSKGLDEKMFALMKRNMKVAEVSKMDVIYQSLLRFPYSAWITDKLYTMDRVDEIELEEIRDFIDKLDWSVRTVTVMRKNKKVD